MSKTSRRLENPPKYNIGQAVEVEIESEHKPTGLRFKHKVKGYIMSISADGAYFTMSGELIGKKDTYKYSITRELPGVIDDEAPEGEMDNSQCKTFTTNPGGFDPGLPPFILINEDNINIIEE